MHTPRRRGLQHYEGSTTTKQGARLGDLMITIDVVTSLGLLLNHVRIRQVPLHGRNKTRLVDIERQRMIVTERSHWQETICWYPEMRLNAP